MDRKKLIVFTVTVYLCCGVNSMDSNNSMLSAYNNNNNNNTPMAMAPQSNDAKSDMKDISKLRENNLSDPITACNETFQIPINYLEELNMTGSYPDETEKLPMCFMKCYLEASGVLSSDNEVTIEQATSHFSCNDDIISNCIKDQSDIDSFDPCEYAYFLSRCIMMATLVDNRKSDT